MSDAQAEDERVLAPKHILDDAAKALTEVLNNAKIGHAFCGGYLAMTMGVPDRGSEDVDCIVQGNMHAIKAALLASHRFEINAQGVAEAAGAVHIHYLRPDGTKSPVELLRAGEFGPAKLTASNTTTIHGIRFLSATEFVRSKVKAWSNRGASRDRTDILWMLENMSEELDIDRINPDGDLEALAEVDEEVGELWYSLWTDEQRAEGAE